MSEQKTVKPVPKPEIEASLTELFHAPAPEAKFVERFERSLQTRARQQSQAPTLSQRFAAMFSTTARGVAWGMGALLLIALLAWGIRNLIPAVMTAQSQTPVPGIIATSPEKSPEGAGPFIAGTFSGLDSPDDLVTFHVRAQDGQEPIYGTQRGNGPWEAVLSSAQDGDQLTVTAEAVGYIVSPASYSIMVQDGQVYLLEDGKPGGQATALAFVFFYPAAEIQTYTNQENGFSFSYPGDWTLEEAPHYTFLRKGPFRVMIAYRRPEESHQIQPTGMSSGEFVQAGSVLFLGKQISRTELNMDNRVKKVLYNSAREIQFADIAFVLVLDAGQNDYAAIDIPEEIQVVADQVLASFTMPGIQPLPPLLSSEGLGRVAYIQNGDIWVKPLPDGEPLRLTTDGLNSRPLWSPSGMWLAYLHGEGELNLVRADGTGAHTLAPGPVDEFAWSPTADRLAFTLSGERDGELWVANADGTGSVNLFKQAAEDGEQHAGRVGDFLWHPLGGMLLYHQWSEAPNQMYPGPVLWEVNAFTGNGRRDLLKNVTEQPDNARLAGWLAEGKTLLIWTGYANSASLLSDEAPLHAWPYPLLPYQGNAVGVIDMLPYKDYLSADPTNTGRLAVIKGVGRETWSDKSLFLYDYSSRQGQDLTGNDQAVAFPAFSENGMKLAYTAMPAQEAGLEGLELRQALLERNLWLIDLPLEDSGKPGPARQLTADPAFRDERPEWSRDGKYLLFPRLDAADSTSLWMLAVDGGEPFPAVDSLASGLDGFGYYGYVDWDAFYDWWQPPAAAPDEYPPLPDLPGAVATPAAALEPPTATFSEPQAGYTFDYPQGWYLNSVPGTTEVSSSDPSTWPVKGSLPSGETQVLFLNDAALKGATFIDVRAATLESIDLAGGSVLVEEDLLLPGNVLAVRLQVNGPDGEYAALVTVLNGAPLQVYGYGDLALFEAIIATLR